MISGLRVPRVRRGGVCSIWVDGAEVNAYEGETIAAALLGSGRRVLRMTDRGGVPRSVFCGVGHCWDCLVTVDGIPGIRACLAAVTPGCRVTTQTLKEAP